MNKGNGTVAGYNVQIAVDREYKLLIDVEVVNDGNDTQQLSAMAMSAKEILGVERLVVDADCGYYNQEKIKECVDHGITPYVAIPDKDKAVEKEGRFIRKEFVYHNEQDVYHCPAGNCLVRHGTMIKGQKALLKYS